jgi:hypothetical protein
LNTVIVDLDGTLALRSGRGPYEWDRVAEDRPNSPVVAVVLALRGVGFEIVVVTGRESSLRAESEAWLLNALGYLPILFMREAGDYRPDFRIKEEILRQRILPNHEVFLVIDDRQQCVDLWRGMGYPTFQVADGNF